MLLRLRVPRLASSNFFPRLRPAAPEFGASIPAGVIVTGTVRTSGSIRIEGQVRGDVHADSVVLARGALVAGDISAAQVVVSGIVDGTIRAQTVAMTRTADVRGDIVHVGELSIATGAQFAGRAERLNAPRPGGAVPAAA
jgi:cytoskeletal protein CcmA (bactofilin family)